MCSAVDSVPRMWPMPWQRGQGMYADSASAGRSRWRDSSIRPKREILPSCTRARSYFSASRRRVSTSRWFLVLSMSMKSITMRPPRSRRRNWRAISSAASQIRVERRRLDVAALGGARRVDVDRDQRFGVVDHDRAARGQRHLPRVRGLDLVLDLEAREERDVVLVELDAVHVGRHHVAHELLRLLVDRFRVDQELADVRVEVVADRADDEARLLVDQVGAGLHLRGVLDRVPELHEVIHVPLQLFGGAADARGAGDDAHALRHVEAVDGVAQLVALLAFDAARDAAAARIVRHQDEIASRERDVGGEGCALVAALVLVDLDDQLLAFLELVLDPRACRDRRRGRGSSRGRFP